MKQGIDEQLLEIMKQDKKNTSGNINFSLPDKIGNCQINVLVDNNLIKESLEFYRNL